MGITKDTDAHDDQEVVLPPLSQFAQGPLAKYDLAMYLLKEAVQCLHDVATSSSSSTSANNKDNDKNDEGDNKIAIALAIANAQEKLGRCYASGVGVSEVDNKRAFEWFLEAAKAGNGQAQSVVGHWYLNSDHGTRKNDKKAHEWLLEAALNGVHKAQYSVGRCYEDGQGIAQDKAQAMYWFKKSAQNNNTYAMYVLGASYEEGVIDTDVDRTSGKEKEIVVLGKDLHKAKQWYAQGASLGDEDCAYELGQLYYKEGSYELAVKWFTAASQAGHAKAQYALATDCYQMGRGVPKDKHTTMCILSQYAMNHEHSVDGDDEVVVGDGNNHNQHNFAKLHLDIAHWYLYDVVAKEDSNERKLGFDHLLHVLQNSSPNPNDKNKQLYYYAAFELGKCYHQGRGCAVDYNMAKHYWQIAANAPPIEKDYQFRARAQHNLGVLLIENNNRDDVLGTENRKLGVERLLMTADFKGPDERRVARTAWYNLGVWYTKSTSDWSKTCAFDWFLKAAKEFNFDYKAMMAVSYHYRYGRGVEKNVDQANYWWNKIPPAIATKLRGQFITFDSYPFEYLE